jgi:hypothetical protein
LRWELRDIEAQHQRTIAWIESSLESVMAVMQGLDPSQPTYEVFHDRHEMLRRELEDHRRMLRQDQEIYHRWIRESDVIRAYRHESRSPYIDIDDDASETRPLPELSYVGPGIRAGDLYLSERPRPIPRNLEFTSLENTPYLRGPYTPPGNPSLNHQTQDQFRQLV